jgi:hypothetical protein
MAGNSLLVCVWCRPSSAQSDRRDLGAVFDLELFVYAAQTVGDCPFGKRELIGDGLVNRIPSSSSRYLN